MRISREHRFVFISTPKVCTHSIYEVLEKHYSRGLLKKGFHSVLVPPKFSDYFRWTVVRNPYDRAVSLWWSGCRCHEPDIYGFRKGCGEVDDFTQFAVWLSNTTIQEREREPLMMCQSEWLQPAKPIHIVCMERLEEDLRTLPFWKEGIKVPQLNTTTQKIQAQEKEEGHRIERPSWQELCRDREAREAVLRWAARDFQEFGYSTEVV